MTTTEAPANHKVIVTSLFQPWEREENYFIQTYFNEAGNLL